MRNYGAITLTASPVQTFTEPLTVADVREFLNLPERSPADDAETALLESLIIAAREAAEILQGRDLIAKQYDLYLDAFPCEIELRTPLTSVDLIRYRDSDGAYTTLTENTDYIVDLQRGLVMPPYGDSWPSFTAWPSSAVLVRFTAGYASTDIFWSDAGQRILVGMKQLISHWYTGRLPVEVGTGTVQELPWTLTQLLTAGAVPRAR